MTRRIHLMNEENIQQLEDIGSADDDWQSFQVPNRNVPEIYYIKHKKHTLQFGICDKLQKSSASMFVAKIRNIAQQLGATQKDAMLRRSEKVNKIDMSSHWEPHTLCLKDYNNKIQDLAFPEVHLTYHK